MLAVAHNGFPMSKARMDFSQRLTARAHVIETHLRTLLDDAVADNTPECGPAPGRLAAAMCDATLSGGKRLRPILVLECAALFGVAEDQCLNAAAAVECVHCYSLVHDDLPCMDNDELRRGNPTVWSAYDEWTAVLTGDALLTLAFDILARPDTHPDPETRLTLITTLARASGATGMVQGQALDLAASRLNMPNAPTVTSTMRLQALKTGALIEAACELGGRLGQAPAQDLADLKRYGAALGLAFQISDDLLDLEGTPDEVGKATGKDSRDGKATLVGLLGTEAARTHLEASLLEAKSALERFGKKASALNEIALFVAGRRH